MNQIVRLLILLGFGLFSVGYAAAASTQWQDLGGGKARLLALKDPETNLIEGMIEVRLEPGWKTYWRSPGGSGIPPEFDFSNSSAISIPQIAFPVPEWIKLDGATFFGYKDQVSFVFSGMATDYSSDLSLDMLIGVCEEICIPATANFHIPATALNTSDPQLPIRLQLAKAKLPKENNPQQTPIDFTVSSNQVLARFPKLSNKGLTRLVIAHENGWTSDPVKVGPNSDGIGAAQFTLPPVFANMVNSPQNWNYSIIRQTASDEKVTDVFDGTFSTYGQ